MAGASTDTSTASTAAVDTTALQNDVSQAYSLDGTNLATAQSAADAIANDVATQTFIGRTALTGQQLSQLRATLGREGEVASRLLSTLSYDNSGARLSTVLFRDQLKLRTEYDPTSTIGRGGPRVGTIPCNITMSITEQGPFVRIEPVHGARSYQVLASRRDRNEALAEKNPEIVQTLRDRVGEFLSQAAGDLHAELTELVQANSELDGTIHGTLADDPRMQNQSGSVDVDLLDQQIDLVTQLRLENASLQREQGSTASLIDSTTPPDTDAEIAAHAAVLGSRDTLNELLGPEVVALASYLQGLGYSTGEGQGRQLATLTLPVSFRRWDKLNTRYNCQLAISVGPDGLNWSFNRTEGRRESANQTESADSIMKRIVSDLPDTIQSIRDRLTEHLAEAAAETAERIARLSGASAGQSADEA